MTSWLRRRPAPAAYTLVTRVECHLCHEMEALLDEVLPGHGLAYERVDVDTEAALVERFGDIVPVLLRDGKPVAKVRVDRRQLERILFRRR